MAVTYLESFGWSSSAGGNPFLDRGYVTNWSPYTSQTLQRPGSGGCMVTSPSSAGGLSVTFPVALTPTCTVGMCVGYLTSLSVRAYLGSHWVGFRPTFLEWTINGIYGSMPWNIQASFNYVEFQVSPTTIIIRVNNNEVTRVSGAGFSAGTGNFYIQTPDSDSPVIRIGDVYVTNDAVFRGDCYVRLMPLTDTVLNTGEKQGPAANLADALKVFSGTDFVIYDQSLEATTMELEDITDNPSNIHGVLVRYSTAKTQTDNVTAVPYVETSAGQADLPSHQPGGSYAPKYHTLSVDPADGGAWTKAKVNSLRLGIRRQD